MGTTQHTMATSGEFRALMSGFPSGVAVLTSVGPDGTPVGLTCSSLCSVSVDPPVLLACVRSASPTLDAILRFGGFAVNLLHENARATSELFSSGAPDRFDRVAWRPAPASGLPHLVDQAHTVADCEIRSSETVGDHTVVFGGVRRVRALTSAPPRPLVYGLRRYTGWPPR
ncbi:flavin reductase family protein [Streptomyces acidiscabies]|uniref:Flavin reductase family protein n=1 Tax=Streptomyces acidiscabies TaxID=42234 RepID=A0AAP6EFQ9_9ACTN|nr:flavin reductase family protein [Streptomyces acidiscabies]MDX2960530.1 flavin reductase family protein [Streptomyces acidiscabies]MDX3017816.1 flavin reductase family protein [Streptomyces acidiscabies]MDX3791411.1 flavin reductase family protein [Streptomyces acidiscabies]